MSSEWTHDLVLQNEELDRHHAILFARLGNASEALEGSTDEVEEAVAKFADDLMAHLTAEEALMEEAGYPDRGRHKSAHELFLADFVQLRAELRELGPTAHVAEWIRARIPEWLRFHVRVNDAPLADYLARHKPQPGDARQRKGDTHRLS
jgi:hemerythrin